MDINSPQDKGLPPPIQVRLVGVAYDSEEVKILTGVLQNAVVGIRALQLGKESRELTSLARPHESQTG